MSWNWKVVDDGLEYAESFMGDAIVLRQDVDGSFYAILYASHGDVSGQAATEDELFAGEERLVEAIERCKVLAYNRTYGREYDPDLETSSGREK